MTIQATDGRSWSSNWKFPNATISNANTLEDSRVLAADGPAWLSLNVEPEFFLAVKDTPVHVHLSAAFTALVEPRAVSLAASGLTRHLPDEGICSVVVEAMGTMVFCSWPSRAPARSYVHVRSLRTGLSAESLVSTGSYAPFSTDGSLWDSGGTAFSNLPPPLDVQLVTWRAADHFERTLDTDLYLRDYAYIPF